MKKNKKATKKVLRRSRVPVKSQCNTECVRHELRCQLSAPQVFRPINSKHKVLLMLLQAKRQQEMFIRLLSRSKSIKQGNVDAFLG